MCALGMFERFEQALRGLTLRALLAVRDRFEAFVAEQVGEFDQAGLWELDAATSMQAWLRDQAGFTSRSAARLVPMARKLAAMPLTLEAWRSGRLRGGQVEAISANVLDKDLDLYVEHEAELVETMEGLDTAETGEFMRSWKAHVDSVRETEPQERVGKLHLNDGLDGHGFLDAERDAETNQLVKIALRLAESSDVEGEPERSPAKRRHDALGDVMRFFLDHQTAKVGGRHRPHLNVLVEAETMEGRYVDGAAITSEVVERLLCDSGVHRVLTKGRSTILDMGMTTRVITAALWVALVARDQHCRFPGCDRPAHWCEGHHVIWVTRNGPTNLGNLVLLCSRHHHLLHRPGWNATLAVDGTFTVTFPDGRVRSTSPPLARARTHQPPLAA
jgi:hypothetical protein